MNRQNYLSIQYTVQFVSTHSKKFYFKSRKKKEDFVDLLNLFSLCFLSERVVVDYEPRDHTDGEQRYFVTIQLRENTKQLFFIFHMMMISN